MKLICLYLAIFFSFAVHASEETTLLNDCLNEAELEMIHLQIQRLNSGCVDCNKFEASNDDVKKDDRNRPLATYSCVSSKS
jgi:hypothetical protein